MTGEHSQFQAEAQAHPELVRCAETFAALEAALQAEQQALLDRDPEVLLAMAERKRGLLQELQQAAVALVKLPAAPDALRTQIEQSFERCRQLNQISGGYIAASRGATEKALALLRGDRFDQPLYGRQGETGYHGLSRTFAEA